MILYILYIHRIYLFPSHLNKHPAYLWLTKMRIRSISKFLGLLQHLLVLMKPFSLVLCSIFYVLCSTFYEYILLSVFLKDPHMGKSLRFIKSILLGSARSAGSFEMSKPGFKTICSSSFLVIFFLITKHPGTSHSGVHLIRAVLT